MACKHFYKNTPLPQADEIFGYIQRTQAGNRNADAILKILQNHNLISPRKFSTGMHHIRMGKDVFEQYKHVGYVNEVARKHYGGKNLLNITERGRVYGNRYKGNSNIDYTVTVNVPNSKSVCCRVKVSSSHADTPSLPYPDNNLSRESRYTLGIA
jgi:hypothetical protein